MQLQIRKPGMSIFQKRLNYLIQLLEESLGKKAIIDQRPPEAGDVPITFADISKSQKALGYNPRVKIQEGIPRFIEWFRRSTTQI